MNDLQLDDEILSAYLDDELDAAQRRRVDTALESDAGAKIRLERMRSADQRLRRELPAKDMPRPDPLAEYILRTERETSAKVPARWRGPASWMALAAGVAGVALGFLLARGESSHAVAALPRVNEPLRQALETRASGEKVVAGDESLTVLLTITAADGRACRLFAARGAHSGSEGLACRDADGWRVVAWDGLTAGSEGFHTAGASALLDSAMDRLGGSTLDAAAERGLISRQWATAPKR